MTGEPSPSVAGIGLTAGAGALGAGATLLSGVWVGLVGVALAVGGIYRCSRRLLGAGVIALFVGVVVAGLLGTPYWLLVPAMAGTVVTWDVGENAIGIAEQFPDDGATWRGELLHATVSALLVTVFAAAATAAYSLSAGGYPLIAVAFLIAGSLIVLVGLGR